MNENISRRTLLGASLAAVTAPVALAAGATATPLARHTPRLLVGGLGGAFGATVGPDGALYVAEGVAGRVSRIDRTTGARSTFVDGLPARVAPVGGPMDVAFRHGTAYVLVSIVGPEVGGTAVDGIYRVDGPGSSTPIADIGSWSVAHPPTTSFFIPSGVQFALQPYRGGFLVTDGHHNRVLQVGLDGGIRQVQTFEDLVPTGMARHGWRVYLTQAGPNPHLPETGRVLVMGGHLGAARPVASGARLAVGVAVGPDGALHVLSQGYFTPGNEDGSPAEPGTGAILRVGSGGTMTPVVEGLDRPVAFEVVGHTAYVTSLADEVWRVRL